MSPLRRDECICCGSRNQRDYLESLLTCTSCSHVWADVDTTGEQIDGLYGAGYFQGGEYEDYEAEAVALRRNFAGRVRDLAGLLPEGGRLWEIGAAYGFFLDEARAHFDVSGCDISEHAARYARERLGLDVRAGDYLRMATQAPYDVVCAWDVVEHLQEPDLFLAKAARELRSGGILALSTGDIGAWTARIRGRHWRLIHPPSHIHYFTQRSIRTLLFRLGFSDVTIRHFAFWRNADTVGKKLLAQNVQSPLLSVYRWLHAAGLLAFNFPLNLFDIMTVYARKA